MSEGFRIQTVVIEGFKAFTNAQEVDFRGRHAFLLGQNGNGKSSIIEAIRWGLFGSAGRPNEVIANQDYVARCRVIIRLTRGGKLWTLQRTLIRGASGGSDAILTDSDGKEHPIRDIMPQLDSVDAGEGVHIIFAPQATPLRRQPENLDAFERTVFDHLGLTHPRVLLSHVGDLLTQQEIAEEALAKELTDVRQSINTRINSAEDERRKIQRAAPWDSDRAPSVAESENKARVLIEEITGEPLKESLVGVSLDALIDNAEDALSNIRARDEDSLGQQKTYIAARRKNLVTFRTVQEAIGKIESMVQSAIELRDGALEGNSLPELRNIVEQTRAIAETETLKRGIIQDAIAFLNRDQSESVFCPVCEEKHHRDDLASKLENNSNQPSSVQTSHLGQLNARLEFAEKHESEVQGLGQQLAELLKKSDACRAELDPSDEKELPDKIDLGLLDAMINRLQDIENSLQANIKGQQDSFEAVAERLSKLRKEEIFHQLQKDLARLRQSQNQLEQAIKAHGDLVSFGESVRGIHKAVETCLTNQLDQDIPRVSENLSTFFAALTNHTRFDQLVIAKDKLPKLELRVASSRDPQHRVYPTQVLNGQAESALKLVPYFAFSQANDAPTEVYLVLLDDPTQAFDEDHIRILAHCLAGLGRHVQVMVASQESPRFRELLPKHFERASYVVVEPQLVSYIDGPQLSVEYE